MNWLIKKILGFAGRALDGKKTKIGAIGAILFGICGAINIMFPNTVPGVNLTVDELAGYISGGFVALGIGGKLDKNTSAVKESANVQQSAAPEEPVRISPAGIDFSATYDK